MFFLTTERFIMVTTVRPVRGGERKPAQKITSHTKGTASKKVKPPLVKKIASPSPKMKRLYVLDTNVLMHDPSCIFRFEEHNVFIPSMVLEELDNHKKGNTEISQNVREAHRMLDKIFSGHTSITGEGVSLKASSEGLASGRLLLQMNDSSVAMAVIKPDDIILAVVCDLINKNKGSCEVVLVSKDVNMRLKALTMGILSEDYHNDMVIEDTEFLPSGIHELPPEMWGSGSIHDVGNTHGNTYRVTGQIARRFRPNEFVYSGTNFSARVTDKTDKHLMLHRVKDFSQSHHTVCGIHSRNREQNFALNLLTDPEIDLVVLVGVAGSGKTLLALAAGIAQVLEAQRYTEIIMTRATVPVGDEIGFLPGNEEEKMGPWMGALDDNLDVLATTLSHHEEKLVKGKRVNLGELQESHTAKSIGRMEAIRSRIKIKSMSFMRGRTFLGKYIIIDEVQNLTQKQAKTLVTRAGPGTKMVCMGNLAQIDTPFLTEGSSGLSHLVRSFHDWKHSGHIILPTGERSRLASHANDVM
jgi:PhoH-like ATPase